MKQLFEKNMSVSTTNSNTICHNKEEVVEIIKQGAVLPYGDEIWMSNNGETHPCLEILIKGQYACVHYFQDDQGHAWQSCGDCGIEVTFLVGDMAWTAPEYVIIPIEKAIICMGEFWDTLERPMGIEWEALWEEG